MERPDASKTYRRSSTSLCCRARTHLEPFCKAVIVRLEYPSALPYRNEPFSLMLSRQPFGPTTIGTPTALQTDANAETQPRALSLRFLCRIAEVLYNSEKRAEASRQR